MPHIQTSVLDLVDAAIAAPGQQDVLEVVPVEVLDGPRGKATGDGAEVEEVVDGLVGQNCLVSSDFRSTTAKTASRLVGDAQGGT